MLLVFLDYTSPLPCSKITQNVTPSYQAREMEMKIQTWAVFSVVRKHAIEIECSAVTLLEPEAFWIFTMPLE